MENLLEISTGAWLEELKGIKEFFRKFKKTLPAELWDEFKALEARLLNG
jgi:GTP-dependent phosphoenolpyruvate carboxykinase